MKAMKVRIPGWTPEGLFLRYEDGTTEMLKGARIVSCEVSVPDGCTVEPVKLEFVESVARPGYENVFLNLASDLFNPPAEKTKKGT